MRNENLLLLTALVAVVTAQSFLLGGEAASTCSFVSAEYASNLTVHLAQLTTKKEMYKLKIRQIETDRSKREKLFAIILAQVMKTRSYSGHLKELIDKFTGIGDFISGPGNGNSVVQPNPAPSPQIDGGFRNCTGNTTVLPGSGGYHGNHRNRTTFPSKCPYGYKAIGFRCFRKTETPSNSYQGMSDECLKLKGSIAKFRSLDEFEKVMNAFRATNDQVFRAAIKRENVSGIFSYDDGTEIPDELWGVNQPTNIGNCGKYQRNGLLQSYDCDAERGGHADGFCQYEADDTKERFLATENSEEDCPDGYTLLEDRCLKQIVLRAFSHKDAVEVCASEGATLASPRTAKELASINRFRNYMRNENTYVSARRGAKGKFFDEFGQEVLAELWVSGFPKAGADCAIVFKDEKLLRSEMCALPGIYGYAICQRKKGDTDDNNIYKQFLTREEKMLQLADTKEKVNIKCPYGYTLVGTRCFRKMELMHSQSHQAASDECLRIQGSIVKFRSFAEMETLKRALGLQSERGLRFRIGSKRNTTSELAYYDDGTMIPAELWGKAEHSDKLCVAFTNFGMYYMIDCNEQDKALRYVICQYQDEHSKQKYLEVANSDETCPHGYFLLNNRCLKQVPVPQLTYENAVALCKKQGGDLTDPRSKDEFDSIRISHGFQSGLNLYTVFASQKNTTIPKYTNEFGLEITATTNKYSPGDCLVGVNVILSVSPCSMPEIRGYALCWAEIQ